MSEIIIKCKNCGATGSSMTNFNVLIICPYCFEPMRKPTPENIIKDLIFEYDEDILVNSMLLSLIVSLLDIKQQKFLKLIRTAINKDIPKKMYNLRYESEEVQTSNINVITRELITKTGMKNEDAKEIISYFANALGYKVDIAYDNYKLKNINTSQSTIVDSSNIRIGDTITFGDVEWFVLDTKNDTTLLLSKYILQKHPYHSKCSSVTWGRSTMRKYLNGVFLKRFTTEEQSKIIETQNINNDNLWYGTNGGRDTKDKIFLLSIEEADKYFGDSGEYQNSKPITKSNSSYFSNSHDNKRIALFNYEPECWWLRSPGCKNSSATIVDYEGKILVEGNFDFEDENGGVRPALWLKM